MWHRGVVPVVQYQFKTENNRDKTSFYLQGCQQFCQLSAQFKPNLDNFSEKVGNAYSALNIDPPAGFACRS